MLWMDLHAALWKQSRVGCCPRELQITYWAKAVPSFGEREVKSSRDMDKAEQHLVFAHRSSGCNLGWQIIKCVNQGQA